jgi:bifunctional non-homologous end joining protein LigD
MPERQRVRVGERELTVSNLDKVLYPATSTTKADVLRHYLGVAEVMLPHLRGRPVTLRRFPDGVTGEAFYQKHCPQHRPEWMGTIEVGSRREGAVVHCELAEPAALAWTANLGGLELHTPMGRAPALEVPTAVVFDLDPGAPADVLDCAWLALRIRELLGGLSLSGFAKSSGSKGLQVYVPLNQPDMDFDRTRSFAHAVALLLEERFPERVVSTQTKALRPGKVLVDWTQNHPKKTTVCVYSLRGRPRPGVSAPLEWAELEAADEAQDPSGLVIELDATLARVAEHGDLFAPVLTLVQELPPLG